MTKLIFVGNAARYVKPSCIDNNKVLPSAFDLRDTVPPEKYISFFVVTDSSKEGEYENAILLLKERGFAFKQSGGIAIVNVEECLKKINDDKPFIEFIEADLPHCGLRYLVDDLQSIHEAKTVLAMLVNKGKSFKTIFSLGA